MSNFNEIYNRALGLLARREHSVYELRQKLRSKLDGAADIPAVLDLLIEEGSISDQRYAESYLRSRAARGYGPTRISIELGGKGVDDVTRSQAIAEASIDWAELALNVMEKKFGMPDLDDFSVRAKCKQFLIYRGFKTDHIESALAALQTEQTESA